MLTKVENLIGQTIAGYRLLEVLGRGGMSWVFLAQRLDNPQERVAFKVLVPSSVTLPEELSSFQARFLREAHAANHLHHPHILPVLGFGAADDMFYMIMPVIMGGTLAEFLASKHSPLPLAEIAGYLNQLASAIDYAHQQGLIHRDIKPSNVLRDEQGNAYLVDFGILQLFDNGLFAIDEAPTTLTAAGKMYGTPAYMAPERFMGEPSQPATDIYALGVLLYQLVTGQVPFKADGPLAVGLKHLNEMPPSPRSLRPDLPEPAEAAILQALAKQPEERFATASALAVAFDAGIKGQWAPGLLPLAFPPHMPLYEADTQREQAVLAPLGPIAEGSLLANQLVLGAAPPYAASEVPVADTPTQADLPPVLPRSSSQGHRRPLLAAAALIGIGLLALLLLLGVQQWHSSPGQQTLPTSTSGVPLKKGVTPTPSTRVTPTPSSPTTPTSGVTPIASPQTTPSPGSTPSSTPGLTPTLSPTSTPKPTPTSTPTPTPTADPTP